MRTTCKLLVLGLLALAHSSSLQAADDAVIFDPRVIPNEAPNVPGMPEGGVAGQIFATGFKKLPPDDAIHQWTFDFEAGAFEQRSSAVNASEWKNLYLAFAVNVHYLRDCYGSKTTALCTFFHSGLQVSANLTWSDVRSSDRYAVMLIPIEYVTGTFGRSGPVLETTSGAFYVTIGSRAEYVRDLALEVQNRVVGLINASVNYASPSMGVAPNLGFHWIGSVRLFAGGMGSESTGVSLQGGLTGGLESKIGIALDLAHGSIAFTNTARLEGDFGLGGTWLRSGYLTDRIELKYMSSVCRGEKSGGCMAPRVFNYGGGIRYEYATSSQESEGASLDRSIHRLIFFAELGRF